VVPRDPVDSAAGDRDRRGPTRAQLVRAAFALPLAATAMHLPLAAPGTAPQMNTRTIPSTREPLPVIGCGTYIGFDQAPGTPPYALLAGVVGALLDAGGKVLDSSPMYGRAEETTGELLAASGRRGEAFLATKVWTRGKSDGIRQMETSLRLLRSDRIDLMQIHNLVDWRTHLQTLRSWKDEGRIRYLGVTHYTSSAYPEVEAVLSAERLDFLQINYALDDRAAEHRLLPLAAERGVAVIVNMPFGGGGLLRGLLSKPLPAWAAEVGCTSWAQLLLKFVLGNPAVTCVIPGTRRREHMEDNARAGFGSVPPPAFWRDKVDRILR
jgi:diketogulonate reductase-like aldo/keto reductase